MKRDLFRVVYQLSPSGVFSIRFVSLDLSTKRSLSFVAHRAISTHAQDHGVHPRTSSNRVSASGPGRAPIMIIRRVSARQALPDIARANAHAWEPSLFVRECASAKQGGKEGPIQVGVCHHPHHDLGDRALHEHGHDPGAAGGNGNLTWGRKGRSGGSRECPRGGDEDDWVKARDARRAISLGRRSRTCTGGVSRSQEQAVYGARSLKKGLEPMRPGDLGDGRSTLAVIR